LVAKNNAGKLNMAIVLLLLLRDSEARHVVNPTGMKELEEAQHATL
jgi:hypothetical protein